MAACAVQFFFALILLTVIGLAFVGCSTQYIPTTTVEKVVYKDTTIFIEKLVEVPVPYEVVKEVLPTDTTSILQTSVALSEAKVEKGTLTHRLEQKGVVKTQIDTVVTVQYVDRYIEKPIIQEVEVIKYKRDTIFWVSILLNIAVMLFTTFNIYLKMKI